MRQDIVKLIEGEKDITNAIVLTHNIDFVFIQSVVLPALRRCGHPSLTVFADAQCASESYQSQHWVLDSLGTRFRVVPVSMNPGFRFHPKAVLLSGQKKGILLVGSGNLTFGGWRENAETWCRLDSDVDGTAPFSAFLDYLEKVVDLTPLRGSLTAEINECFDERLRPWAHNMAAPGVLLGRPSSEHSLIDQMKAVVQAKPVRSLLIHSPYFDDAGHALKQLSSEFNVAVKVAAQLRRSGLSAEACRTLGDAIGVSTVNFQHRAADEKTREAFIHTKWYAFEHEDSYTVFLGSANCSKAALTIPGNAGNAELMMSASLTKQEFETNFSMELEFLDVDPQLPSLKMEVETDGATLPSLLIRAARLDEGCLQIAYSNSNEVSLYKLILDGREVEYVANDAGVIVVNSVPADSRQVCLQGKVGSQSVISNLHWIDHEQSLSTTARSRSVVDAVRSKVQPQSWNIGAWSDIANVFLRNLQYMPRRMGEGRVPGVTTNREDRGHQQYTAEDVFSASYGLPIVSQINIAFPTGFDDRVTSLRQLLMRWFGYKGEEDTTVPHSGEPDHDGDDDAVDRPENLATLKAPVAAGTKSSRKTTESDRKRALKILSMVTEQMTSDSYLTERHPETISVDIQFASVLLRSGLCEGWITEDEFFESTHQIWSSLFFTSGPDSSRGWLEYRYLTSIDKEEFAKKLVSPKLTAALAAWTLAVPERIATPERIRFSLSKVLSVARLPWLWNVDSGEDIAKELHGIVSSSEVLDPQSWNEIMTKWVAMIRNGYALRIFEELLDGITPGEIKDRISQKEVKRGDLLWQGTVGFCIATEDFVRSDDKTNTNILYLQKAQSIGSIRTFYAIPISALLSEGIVGMPEAPTKVLCVLLDSLVL